jgi:hypothetical protein
VVLQFVEGVYLVGAKKCLSAGYCGSIAAFILAWKRAPKALYF